MFAGEGEGALCVVESNLTPTLCGMALRALSTQITLMLVIVLVAGVAILRNATEDHPVRLDNEMTIFARYLDVLPGECECALCMVEGNLIPTFGDVAARALGTELPLVLVVFQMASSAILGRSTKDQWSPAFGCMTCSARCLYVRANKSKVGQAVVEFNLFPTGDGMARFAGKADLRLMGVVLAVTARAIPWSIGKALKRVNLRMAGCTPDLFM